METMKQFFVGKSEEDVEFVPANKLLTKTDRWHKRNGENLDEETISEDNFPCYNEHIMSLKCTQREGEDCTQFFKNYKACKKFWRNIEKERFNEGIIPYTPPPSERKKILDEYLKTKSR